MIATLQSALAQRSDLPPHTDCFRWVDREVEGVTVDVFGRAAIVSYYRPSSPEEELKLAHALVEVRPLTSAVYVKRRPKEARTAQRVTELAPAVPLLGEAISAITVQEEGTAFEIVPGNGLSVGLYLDARVARARVRSLARGRTVLNLFAYTCGFGLAALRGGATRAVNVDLSRRVLEWGERNYRLNGFAPERRDFIAGESFEWLQRFAKKGERYGLVILDPPSFATAERSRFSAAKDYAALVATAAPAVEPGGLLVACCNLESLSAEHFQAQVLKGLGAATVLEHFGASPMDFAQPSALKALVLSPG